MNKYITSFTTTEEFNTSKSGLRRPHVSLTKDDMKVHYMPYDYSDMYLTFIALEDGTFTLTIGSEVSTSILESISYSIDNGETWITTNNQNNNTMIITTPTINQGDRVLWKGIGVGVSTTTNNNDRPPTSSIFSSTGEFDVEGNILSLVWGDDFADKDYVAEGSSYNFALLFYSNVSEATNHARVVSAENMCLPIKNVPEYCYYRMFQGRYGDPTFISTLIKAPKCIGAESIGSHSCQSMFIDCINLTTTPKLPATTLATYCYQNMFYNCTSLTTAPELPATTLADNCYDCMFYDCTNLTIISELSATTLANYCCQNMFYNCTSLIVAPELPATTLATGCYYLMFKNCTSLIIAPELSSTTLADGCYGNMFENCINLITAPELPATTLSIQCYHQMFDGCTSLTTAPELPATTLTFGCYQSMFQDCISLITAPELPATTLANYCYNIMFLGCTSLTVAPELPATTLVQNCYGSMFRGCTALITAPELPATELANNCYYLMFQNCSSLNYIKAMFTTTPSSSYTYNWVNGIAATGIFVKNNAAEWDVTGVNGVPTGWTVQTTSS